MVYLCHLVTPVVTVLLLAITFVPAVDRFLLMMVENNKLAAAIVRLIVVFLAVYITQLLVDRHCDVKHCSR